MFKNIYAVALSSVVSMSLFAGEFSIDETHSKIGFSIKHLMISNVGGEFKKYNAEIIYDEKNHKFVNLTAIVDSGSIYTGIDKRDDHLRSPDFFDVKKYPEIKFVMTKQSSDNIIDGNLTMHGITKEIKLNIDFGGIAKSPTGDKKIGFSLNGKINRKDFGLNWSKALENGGFVVDETVKIIIDIEAVSLDD